jgi:hypothetical protein
LKGTKLKICDISMREMREKCIFEKLKCKTKESTLHPDIASSEKCFEFIPL